jgi:putative transposase
MRKRAPKPAGHEDLGHSIALDPTGKQANQMARAAGCSRFAYNWGLAEWGRQYKSGGKPSANKLKKQFNSIRGKEFPWSYESPRDATSQPFADLDKAFSAFFASIKGTRKGPKIGYPTPRRRGQDDSFYVANDKFRIVGNKIFLPKIGPVKMREELRLAGKILSARVFRKAGRWYVSVQVQGEFRRPTTHLRPIIGVDLGIKVAVMPSHGDPIEAPKPLAANLKQLRRANRKLHRRQKGSKNRILAATGVILVLTSGPSKEPATVAVSPTVTPGVLGVRAGGSW